MTKESSATEFDLVERINEYTAERYLDTQILKMQCGDSSRPAESLLEESSRAVSYQYAMKNAHRKLSGEGETSEQ